MLDPAPAAPLGRRHYEELWREGVEELVMLLDAEHPEDRAAAPKVRRGARRPAAAAAAAGPSRFFNTHSSHLQALEDWARLYIRYVQTLRKLCAAHDGVAQPQKRACLRGTLEACAGRVLELRAWLAGLNGGVDVLGEALGEQLLALSLTPDVLELPVPAYFREARAEALAARAEAAAAAVAEATAAGSALPGEQGAAEAADGANDAGEASSSDEDDPEQGPASPPAAAASEARQELRQAQQCAQQPAASVQEDSQHPAADDVASHEEQERRAAATLAIQAAGRGWLARRRVASQRREEMEFLGMLPAGGGRSAELAGRLAAISAERKQRQVGGEQEER